MCKWAFEIAYEVDAEELNVARNAAKLKTRSVLTLHGDPLAESFATKEQIEQIRHFLVVKSEEKTLRKPAAGSGRTADATNMSRGLQSAGPKSAGPTSVGLFSTNGMPSGLKPAASPRYPRLPWLCFA